jgi:MYXO-CTERM domain-containing protein
MQPVWVRQEWTQAMTIAVAFAAAGIIGGVFLPLLTVNAHGDIDQLPGKQDLDHARLMLTLQVGVAMAAAALAAFAAPRARAMTVGMAALGAVPLAVFAVSAFRDYGRFLSGVGMIWVYFVLGGAAGIAAIVLTAVGAGTLKPQLLGAAVGIVSGWAIAWGLAAGWLLLNLQGEADKAAAANQDSPAITVAALAAVLLLGAAARRRRA